MQDIIKNIKKYAIFSSVLMLLCAAQKTVKQTKISPNELYLAKIIVSDPGAIGSSTERIQIENVSTKKSMVVFGIKATDQIKMKWEKDTLIIYKVGQAQSRVVADSFEKVKIKLQTFDYYSDFFKSLP